MYAPVTLAPARSNVYSNMTTTTMSMKSATRAMTLVAVLSGVGGCDCVGGDVVRMRRRRRQLRWLRRPARDKWGVKARLVA